MIQPSIPSNEQERLSALKSYEILDTLPEQDYDDITYIAAQICGTPISLISLIDEKRQWFKSHHGLDATHTAREIAFCAHAINRQDELLVVPDARKDERFHDNPLVMGDAQVIFYAGAPLVTPEGHALGTLCVIDHKAGQLTEEQEKALKALSNQLIHLLELRRKSALQELQLAELEAKNQGLERFARVAAHDIKSPLGTITMLAELFERRISGQVSEEDAAIIERIKKSSRLLAGLIDGILQYSKSTKTLQEGKTEISLTKLLREIVALLNSSSGSTVTVEADAELTMYTNRVALQQIVLNLLSNALKYNDKEQPMVRVSAQALGNNVAIEVCDNGPGIAAADRERIFEPFETLLTDDRFGEKGNGIGLATVKALVEGMGGTIAVADSPMGGTCFKVILKK